MTEVFRILRRFQVTGIGTVYLIKSTAQTVLSIGDLLYDLHGNRLKVKGFHLFRLSLEGMNHDEMPLAVTFERVDDVDAVGDILVRDLTDVNPPVPGVVPETGRR